MRRQPIPVAGSRRPEVGGHKIFVIDDFADRRRCQPDGVGRTCNQRLNNSRPLVQTELHCRFPDCGKRAWGRCLALIRPRRGSNHREDSE